MSDFSPLVLIIIRHGEKPEAGRTDLGEGVDELGRQDAKSLAVRGWARAGAWAALFGAGFATRDYPSPGAVFAPRPLAPAGASARPAQTAAVIAARLGVPLDIRFDRDQGEALMRDVLSGGGVALICWEHRRIGDAIVPAIPLAFGARSPGPWPQDRFDLALRFDRPAGGDRFAVRQLFPRLLDGDSNAQI